MVNVFTEDQLQILYLSWQNKDWYVLNTITQQTMVCKLLLLIDTNITNFSINLKSISAMEVACGEHGDWTYKLKKAVECMDDLDDDSSLGDESTYEGKQEMALQASTLCLLEEKVDKTPCVIKVNLFEARCYY